MNAATRLIDQHVGPVSVLAARSSTQQVQEDTYFIYLHTYTLSVKLQSSTLCLTEKKNLKAEITRSIYDFISVLS